MGGQLSSLEQLSTALNSSRLEEKRSGVESGGVLWAGWGPAPEEVKKESKKAESAGAASEVGEWGERVRCIVRWTGR